MTTYYNKGQKDAAEPAGSLKSERTTVKRLPKRGVYERDTVNAILDEALVCHVGFARDGQPYVIPTSYARVGDVLYIHGSAASRMLRALAGGIPVCVTVTLLDGLVLARSTFHHSMNYRSAVILGMARLVDDPAEKSRALEAIVEHIVPGRSAEARAPNPNELAATSVLALNIEEASAKIRTGPPIDDAEDMDRSVWAGVLPLRLTPQTPVPDAALAAAIGVPGYVSGYSRS
jgi:nitroimidazol reductase NimA-like FMN-containing flavoprotein (pyridoxamine 5'-phosphate oxidase superfamily)